MRWRLAVTTCIALCRREGRKVQPLICADEQYWPWLSILAI
jgi:hypothetical protein